MITLKPVDDGGVEVELLRTVDWIEREKATVGSSVTLNLPELNINGEAEVVAIDQSPQLEDGPGRLVTGRFRHVADELATIHVEGLTEPIQCTPRHPFWSVDAQEFVEAQHLRQGERLLTNTGETVQVISQTVATTATPVYNIEVHGEHVYRVTELGILVHNASTRQDYVDVADLEIHTPSILSNPRLSNAERDLVQRHFRKKMNVIHSAARRGELTFSPGTDSVRVASLQASYRNRVAKRFEQIYGVAPNMRKLDADHPVDLVIGGKADQPLKMIHRSVNRSVGSSLKNAAERAMLRPGGTIKSVRVL